MDQFESYLYYQKEITEFKLKTIKRLQKGMEPKLKRTSKIDTVTNVLNIAGRPLHVTEIVGPVRIKWVVIRDPKGQLRTEAFFATDPTATEEQILTWFVLRWNIEVTFEELRAHLGFETQRQWSDLAIARTTPALFGMFSVVVLVALELLKSKTMTILTCAWYNKTDATFSDVIALVRRHIWHARNYTNSSPEPDSTYLQGDLLETLLDIVCYAA